MTKSGCVDATSSGMRLAQSRLLVLCSARTSYRMSWGVKSSRRRWVRPLCTNESPTCKTTVPFAKGGGAGRDDEVAAGSGEAAAALASAAGGGSSR